jgi:ABC-type oligopeptide transport system substrate-binding subunit
MAEFAASQLQAVGIEAKLRTLEWRTMLEMRAQGKLQMYVGSWYGDYLDAENFLSLLLTSGAEQNWDGWKDAEFDALCAQADRETDPTRRRELYQLAEDRAIGQAMRVPIHWVRDALLVSPRVRSLEMNLFGTVPFLATSVE